MELRELIFNKKANALLSAIILSSVISTVVILAGVESSLVCCSTFFICLVTIYLTLMYVWREYD